MKILILGHNGMLGNTVYSYFMNKHDIFTTSLKWDSNEFKKYIENVDVDFIINCIGAIPQKKYANYNINIDLPVFLGLTDKKIIHPSTDCEFSGNLKYPKKYSKNAIKDAEDDYGKSKALIASIIEKGKQKNIKIIRTSIIGHELSTHYSLLEWFLQSKGEVNGYSNHYWNGVTTLFWSEIADRIINNWNHTPVVTQIGTSGTSKYELLEIIKEIYEKNIKINKFNAEKSVNKMLKSDFKIPNIGEQLHNLKQFNNELC